MRLHELLTDLMRGRAVATIAPAAGVVPRTLARWMLDPAAHADARLMPADRIPKLVEALGLDEVTRARLVAAQADAEAEKRGGVA